MKFYALVPFATLLLLGCAQSPDNDQLAKAREEGVKAGIAQERARVTEIQDVAAKYAPAEDPAPTAPEPVAPDPDDLCFEDYCPCEPDPDNSGTEKLLCRNLRNNIPVEPGVLSGAAGMRDARKELREFQNNNPDF